MLELSEVLNKDKERNKALIVVWIEGKSYKSSLLLIIYSISTINIFSSLILFEEEAKDYTKDKAKLPNKKIIYWI